LRRIKENVQSAFADAEKWIVLFLHTNVLGDVKLLSLVATNMEIFKFFSLFILEQAAIKSWPYLVLRSKALLR